MAKGKPVTISDETRILSDYIADALNRDLPESVVEAAKHHILDTLAAIVSGSRLPPGGLAIQYVAGLGGGQDATVIGSDQRATAADAAMANGMSAHSDETDDSHFTSRMHPGAAILPAALAVAEQRHSSGTDFLRALVLGYDVGSRLVHALDMRGFAALHRSCHSYGGTFGAGAAAGALHRLDAEHARYLLSYCAQLASGCGAYMHDRGHIEKAFVYAGKSAQSGVAAAAMVAAGFTAADDAFSGDRNFLDAYGAPPHRAALIDGLGTRYEIVRTNIKKWCVGSPIQPALDGIDTVLRENAVDLATVDRIEVRLAPEQLRTVDNRPMPNVNIQHLIALLLAKGTVGFADSHDPALMEDPAILSVRRRITLIPDEDLEHARPPRQTIVEVTTRDGRRFSRRVVAVRGTPDNPMSRDEVVAKARELIAPVLGERRGADLVTSILDIEAVGDMTRLSPLLSARAQT